MKSRPSADRSEVATVDSRAFLQQRLGITFTADSQRYAESVLAHVERRERELAAADRAHAK